MKYAMNIAHYYRDYLANGGMPRETDCLVNAMAKYVNRVIVYCYTDNPKDETDNNNGNITIRKFYVPKWIWKYNVFFVPTRLKEILQANKDELNAAILTGGFIPENFLVAHLLQRTSIPYFLSIGEAYNPNLFYGLKGLKKSWYERYFERDVLKNATALRLYSDVQIDHLRIRGYRNFKYFFAKEGVDWELLNSLGVSEQEVKKILKDKQFGQVPVFGFMGRIVTYKKGLDLVIKAFSIYLKKGSKGILKIMGPGSKKELSSLNKLIQNSNLNNVEILPPAYGKEKIRFLTNCDLFIHPSRHEGIPRVLREALAVGCPVLITDNTNLHDIVQRYNAGFLSPQDPECIAEEMATFCSLTHQEKIRMRENAINSIKELEWNDVARSYLANIEYFLEERTSI